MKKLIALALTLVLAFPLATCNGDKNVVDGENSKTALDIEFENPSWQTVSINYKDYGIDYNVTEMSFDQFPLDKLVAYYLGADGAYAEGSSDELYRRFLEAPNIVLSYIALIGDDIAGNRIPDNIPAKNLLCEAIVGADVFWYGISDSFSNILEQLEDTYQSGDIADFVRLLRAAHEAAIDSYNNYLLVIDGET